jgi:hypothetical protein
MNALRRFTQRFGADKDAASIFSPPKSLGVLWLLGLLLAGSAINTSAQEQPAKAEAIRFRTVEIFVESGDKPLAAYQLEFKANGGNAKIVGVEGGEPAAFKEAPFYDPKAMQQERVIIAAFSTATADKLPKGKTRVATIHLQITGEQPPRYEVQVKTAATVDGKEISVHANAEEKQRNENEKASGEE